MNHQDFLWQKDLLSENTRLKRINQNLKVNLAHARLRLSAAEAVVSGMPENVWWIDDQGTLLYVNDHFFHDVAHLISASDVLGRNVYELAHELGMSRYEIEAIRMHDQKVFLSGVSESVEHAMTFLGQTSVFLSSKQLVYDPGRKTKGLLVLAVNITALKQEQRLLEHSIQQVERSTTEKIKFLEHLRHDLRSPLTNIISAADIIKHMLDDAQAREFLEAIIANGNHVMEMFAQLIDFFQTRQNTQTNRIVGINFREMVAELTHGMKMHAHNRPIQFHVLLNEDVPECILSDRAKLSRILSNLLGNAFKYTETGMVSLIVQYDDHKESLDIEVRDSGIGIHHEHLDRIFEPMVRVHTDEQVVREGLGLGLSIVDQFVKDLNGVIRVSSEFGKGSSFHLMIPASRERTVVAA